MENKAPSLIVLNVEIAAVRSIYVWAESAEIKRAAAERETVLVAEIARIQGEPADENVIPMAAGFARRDSETEGQG